METAHEGPTGLVRSFRVDNLEVEVYRTRAEMGAAAARFAAGRLGALLREAAARARVPGVPHVPHGTVAVAFAAAPSQNEFLDALSRLTTTAGAEGRGRDERDIERAEANTDREEANVDWSRVVAFQLDEYVGLAPGAPQRFAAYLEEHILTRVKPGRVHLLQAEDPDPARVRQACDDYACLLRLNPLGLACIGIGENGHIAFNDPHVADFNDPNLVKLVTLDEASRAQQVNDGCFADIDVVPTQAITLTIPAIMAARFICCVVPGPTKKNAVRDALVGEVSPRCPASVLRRHPRARLFLDADSASLVGPA